MPDGAQPTPGGWSRLVLMVDDLDGLVDALCDRGAVFRNDVVTGPGGRQILVEDPSGDAVELFEPA
jgi:predicted enzyme related to lactoylglutathione lyase